MVAALGLSLLLSVAAAAPPPAACVLYPEIREEFDAAVSVFEGRVIKTEYIPGRECCHVLSGRATFRVSRTWKGDSRSRMEIGVVGRIFEEGKDYVVFAFGPPPVADGCNRTRVAGESRDTIDWLEARGTADGRDSGMADLTRALLRGFDVPDESDAPTLPSDMRGALTQFRRKTVGLPLAVPLPGRAGSPEHSLAKHRNALARVLVGLFDGPGLPAAAVNYARSARLSYEWEGFADGPLDEAAHAERALLDERATAFRGYLQLFAGHRKLCAVSGLEGLDPSGPRAYGVAEEAMEHLREAADHEHLLIREVARYVLRTRRCLYG
jgi:hypothetical protein